MVIQERPVIEKLGRKHDRNSFSCGMDELDHYIRKVASQDVKRNIARVLVAVGKKPEVIAGYYTLGAASIEGKRIPETLRRKLPGYPIPAARIGRLAVDKHYQGKGLGSYLLMDAIHRVLVAAETVAMYAVVVDAKNDKAKTFYEKYGFVEFRDEPLRLFLPLETFRRCGPLAGPY